MVVNLADLDLAYLCLFVGMRVNEVVTTKLAAAGYDDVRESHGYVFQHLIAGPRTITELAELLGVSQQAASKVVAELVDLGYLATTEGQDRRARYISLTKRAEACIAKTRAIRAQIQERIDKKYGASVGKVRALLAEVLGDLGGVEAVRTRRVREPRY